MNIDEILIIKNDNIYYGISTEYIDQILRVPAITSVVLTSNSILGLSSVSGKIVTVYDTNLILGLEAVDITCEQARLLSLVDVSQDVALVVKEVTDAVQIDPEMIEEIQDSGDGVIALYKYKDCIVQILDISQLLNKVTIDEFNVESVKDGSLRKDDVLKDKMNIKRYLFIKMADERYAIDIESIREIMKLPPEFTPINGSNEEVLGMMPVRNDLLAVVDLRRFFSFNDTISEKNRILVAEIDKKTIGLVVDEILDIRDVESDLIDSMPSNFKDKKISGVIHDKNQLVSLIGDDVISLLLESSAALNNNRQSSNKNQEKSIEFEVVIFTFGDEEYAINIDNVVEIIDTVETTPFADAPKFVDGLINIRGQIVMMMSIYEWLSKPKPLGEDKKIIICQLQDYRIGFYVDSISDVTGIQKSEIKEENDDNEFFTNVLHLDEGSRLVLLFDINKITQYKDMHE
jgi:purine-binding chemotaxis protein CheW